jgi:DNA ligase 1
MLGKTFKGMTDEMLVWQTTELQKAHHCCRWLYGSRPAQARGRDRLERHPGEPSLPGGLALRFARVKRYRPDKRAEDADTIETVRAIHERRLNSGR